MNDSMESSKEQIKKLKCLFEYLKVDSEVTAEFIRKLPATQGDTKSPSPFETFSHTEIMQFIDNDYKEIYRKAYEIKNPPPKQLKDNQLISPIILVSVVRESLKYNKEFEIAYKAKVNSYIEVQAGGENIKTSSGSHIEDNKTVPDEKMFKTIQEAALEFKITQYVQKNNITASAEEYKNKYLTTQKEEFNKTLKGLERLYRVIERVEGPLTEGKKPVFSDWGKHFATLSPADKGHFGQEALNEYTERAEFGTQMACLGFLTISATLALSELANFNPMGLVELFGGGEGYMEGGASLSESISAIMEGKVLMLQGDMKAGMASFSLGVGRVATSALIISAAAAPSAYSAAAAVSLSFMSTGVCCGMAALAHYQVHESKKKIKTLEEKIQKIDGEINTNKTPISNQDMISHFEGTIVNKRKEIDETKLMFKEKQINEPLKTKTISALEGEIEALKEKIKGLGSSNKNNEVNGVDKAKSQDELKEIRNGLGRVLLQETAVKADHEKKREIWMKMATVSAAIAAVGVVAGVSVASAGIVPIVLMGALGGVYVADRLASGKFSHQARLKKSENLMREYETLVKDKDIFLETTGIDFDKAVPIKSSIFKRTKTLTLQNHLKELIVNSPAKAKIVFQKLSACETATEEGKKEARQAFSDALNMDASKLPLTKAEMSKGLMDDFNKILLFKEELKENTGINLEQKIQVTENDSCSLHSYLKKLIHDSPDKAEQVISALNTCSSAEGEENKQTALAGLKAALSSSNEAEESDKYDSCGSEISDGLLEAAKNTVSQDLQAKKDEDDGYDADTEEEDEEGPGSGP